MLQPEYPITTARLVLRPFTLSDLDALYGFQSRPDVTQYLSWEPRNRTETAAALQRRIATARLTENGRFLSIAAQRADTGQLIGDLFLEVVSTEHRQGEIGFVFHPDHHGRGFAGEAAVELLRLGFERLGLHRIIGRCDARNTASAALMEGLGMRSEAHFRENERLKGNWTDELVFAILEHEWKRR
ncbi:GNAT family N-acetyltransferase [Amycolatopsis anabasis]|uniref:GNAT family N-acetyltransferase n=1 Tax=Amycolatopsis anabasis TaxID=1840409 RepID=UPI00131C3AF9|nr:GNAT family protein [Amycolatopsis anabasis]